MDLIYDHVYVCGLVCNARCVTFIGSDMPLETKAMNEE